MERDHIVNSLTENEHLCLVMQHYILKTASLMTKKGVSWI